MSEIIKLPKENLKSLNFFIKGLYFHVVVAAYNENEKSKLDYLKKLCENEKFSTEDICKWCFNQNIKYQILYPVKKWSFIKEPIKYIRYIKLKYDLKDCNINYYEN